MDGEEQNIAGNNDVNDDEVSSDNVAKAPVDNEEDEVEENDEDVDEMEEPDSDE